MLAAPRHSPSTRPVAPTRRTVAVNAASLPLLWSSVEFGPGPELPPRGRWRESEVSPLDNSTQSGLTPLSARIRRRRRDALKRRNSRETTEPQATSGMACGCSVVHCIRTALHCTAQAGHRTDQRDERYVGVCLALPAAQQAGDLVDLLYRRPPASRPPAPPVRLPSRPPTVGRPPTMAKPPPLATPPPPPT